MTNTDIQHSPFLSDWYRQHGFQIFDSERESIGSVVKKIIKQFEWLNSSESTSGQRLAGQFSHHQESRDRQLQFQ